MAGVKHVHDITHHIGIIIGKLYGKDVSFNGFTKLMAEMRVNFAQTASASIIPPKLRKKSRYLNIDAISKWATKALHLAKNNSACQSNNNVCENILWIKEYELFINEMAEINGVILEIEKILKHKGMTKATIRACKKALDTLGCQKGELFKSNIKKYFKSIRELMPTTKTILCSSDIIESTFGKYKNYVSSNPMACLTNLSLSIAAFTSSLHRDEINLALENTKIKDIDNWTKDNIGQSLFKKRMDLLSNS